MIVKVRHKHSFFMARPLRVGYPRILGLCGLHFFPFFSSQQSYEFKVFVFFLLVVEGLTPPPSLVDRYKKNQ